MADSEHSSHAPNGLPPWSTTLVGIGASALAGFITGGVTHGIVDMYAPDNGIINSLSFYAPFVAVGEEAFRTGYVIDVDTGWKAVPAFLGERIPGVLLNEGKHWLPPGLMSATKVDCREQPDRSCEINDKALSADGIEMTGKFIWAYQIFDPYLYLSKARALRALDAIGAGATRNGFAEHPQNLLIKPESKTAISASILQVMQEAGRGFGIDVTKAILTQVLPPQSIIDANAKKATEEAEAIAEKIEARNLMKRIADLKKAGFTPAQAYDVLSAERGKITATRHIHQLGLPDKLVDILGDAIGQAFARRTQS